MALEKKHSSWAALKTEANTCYETFSTYQSTPCHVPEARNLHENHCEKEISRVTLCYKDNFMKRQAIFCKQSNDEG